MIKYIKQFMLFVLKKGYDLNLKSSLDNLKSTKISHNNLDDLSRIKDAGEEVNHPNHYQHIFLGHNNTNFQKFEAVDILDGITDSLGLKGSEAGLLWNSLKYILRAPYKGNEIQDFEKSSWYLSRLIDKLKKERNE